MKIFIAFITTFIFGLFIASFPAYAHVVVKPAEVGVAAYQTFAIGVPNEKDNPTVAVRLIIPEGLNSVSPNVKPGWKIDIKKDGEGEDARVSEVSWTTGSIPVGMRDEFMFSTQAPASETTLVWKAYQTYQDGSVVSWDQAPVTNMSDEEREKMEKAGLGPYSATKVVNDLKSTDGQAALTTRDDDEDEGRGTKLLALAAIVMSLVAIGLPFVMKRN